MRRTRMPRRSAPLPPTASPLAREIYKRMREKGLTAAALAKLADRDPGYIRDIFRGRSKNPKSVELQTVADALGCKLEDLTEFLFPGGEVEPRPGALTEFNDLLPFFPREIALMRMFRAIDDPALQDRAVNFVASLLPTKGKGKRA